MKKSLNFSFNLPEYEDAIDIEKLTDNFSSIDTALMATRVKKTKKANSIEVSAVQPYAVIKNNNEVTITYTDLFDKEWTLEAGKSRKFAIESNSLNNFKVQVKDGLEADFEWFIDVDTAIKEGGGGSGGTSNYNDLENLPKINGVELTGNKSLDNIGAIAANSKGAANGVASLGADGKVPSSQLPTIEQKEYKLAETTSEGYAKGYKLQYKSGSTWVDVSDSAAINIPKDMVVESGSVKECSADNVPVSGYKKGDKYIDLVIANKTDAHIYINVKDLVDNKASGISYSNTDSELDATTVQSAIDEIAEIITGKEDTANRITAWQSTPDNTHYPTEKLVKDSLDKKVQKTSVSLSKPDGETTSVINVTDAKAQMAMVAKISGKTIKGNLFDFANNGSRSTTHKGVTFTNNSDGSFTVSGTSTAGDSYMEVYTTLTAQEKIESYKHYQEEKKKKYHTPMAIIGLPLILFLTIKTDAYSGGPGIGGTLFNIGVCIFIGIWGSIISEKMSKKENKTISTLLSDIKELKEMEQSDKSESAQN